MFVTVSKGGYTRDDSQFSQGYFLILMHPKKTLEEMLAHKPDPPVRGLVRFVRMSQCGHFMMGRINVKGHRIVLSGSYGADGLICDVPQEVYDLGEELPQELYDAWNSGGGWNGAGSEAPKMRGWGLELLKKWKEKR
jgi:hypothetical protein